MIDSLKLKGRIVAAGHTQRTLAKVIGISANSLSSKINGNSRFTCDEVDKLCIALDITDPTEMCQIFLPRHPYNGTIRSVTSVNDPEKI